MYLRSSLTLTTQSTIRLQWGIREIRMETTPAAAPFLHLRKQVTQKNARCRLVCQCRCLTDPVDESKDYLRTPWGRVLRLN